MVHGLDPGHGVIFIRPAKPIFGGNLEVRGFCADGGMCKCNGAWKNRRWTGETQSK